MVTDYESSFFRRDLLMRNIPSVINAIALLPESQNFLVAFSTIDFYFFNFFELQFYFEPSASPRVGI